MQLKAGPSIAAVTLSGTTCSKNKSSLPDVLLQEYEEMRLKARALMAAVGLCDSKCGYGQGQPAAVDDGRSQ